MKILNKSTLNCKKLRLCSKLFKKKITLKKEEKKTYLKNPHNSKEKEKKVN